MEIHCTTTMFVSNHLFSHSSIYYMAPNVGKTFLDMLKYRLIKTDKSSHEALTVVFESMEQENKIKQ